MMEILIKIYKYIDIGIHIIIYIIKLLPVPFFLTFFFEVSNQIIFVACILFLLVCAGL